MGQARQRKKLMGNDYGKVSNPWLKKSSSNRSELCKLPPLPPLPPEERALLEEFIQASGESRLSQWLLWLLDGGIPYWHNGELAITRRNERLIAIAKAAKSNIFLDATMTAEQLAWILGVDKSEIFVCRAKD